MKSINESQIRYLQVRNRDEIGDLFRYKGGLYRGINKEYEEHIQTILGSGLLSKLIEMGIFPDSKVSELKSERYNLIIKHSEITPLIYPQEWSFGMLKKAALMVLEFAQVCDAYGYNMKDCHGLNVCFRETQPMFVDLGSIVAKQDINEVWHCRQEFIRFYIAPLYLWSQGLDHLAKASFSFGNLLELSEYNTIRYWYLRIFPKAIKSKVLETLLLPSRLSTLSKKRIQKMPNHLSVPINALQNITRSYFSVSRDINRFKKTVKYAKYRVGRSIWSQYQRKSLGKAERFKRILEIIRENCINLNTALDVAGNEGNFTSMLKRDLNLNTAICQDLDISAIDYGLTRTEHKDVTYVNYNFATHVHKDHLPTASERFRCDLVTGLAITHHLILSQHYNVEYLMKLFSNYTNRYVLIEFMPNGLWSEGQQITIPDWYSEKWFKEIFGKYFNVLVIEKVGKNNIVFLGEKLS